MLIATHHVKRRSLLAAAGSLIASPAILRAQGSSGVALVIGNSRYKWEASLPNVRRDAPDIARRFQELGLKTELLQDVGSDAMSAAIGKFKEAASGASLAAFYFAGHGASWDKDTYLVPVDTDLGSPNVVRTLPPVKAISEAVKGARNRLLVFDNCRNNPADGWRQRAAAEQSRIAASELAASAVHGPNTLVLFSTAPGRVALDGPAGENSPFAASLLRQLKNPSVDLSGLGPRLRRDLLIATEGQQVIWDESTYTAPFVLSGPASRQTDARNPVDAARIMELTKAYAFAREKKLALPAGLVATLPQNSSPHSRKLGAFEFVTKTAVGRPGNYIAGFSLEPAVMVVLSVPDSGSAQIIYSFRDHLNADGPVWRFSTARLSQEEMLWSTTAFHSNPGQNGNHAFTWQDQNSGKYVFSSTSPAGGMPVTYNGRFTRLDG